MKKLIYLMALAIVMLQANVNAQSRNVTIKNEIGCEIYWDVVAICPGPPCYEFSTSTMNWLGAGGVVSYTPATYPWLPPNAPLQCDDWYWAYAYITFWGYNSMGQHCEPETKRVGIEYCDNGTSKPLIDEGEFTCLCQGKPVRYKFEVDPSTGDATVTVYY